MTHDPLCLMAACEHPDPNGLFKATCGYCEGYCQCDLIAKVRADEKAKWTHTCDGNNCCHQPGE